MLRWEYLLYEAQTWECRRSRKPVCATPFACICPAARNSSSVLGQVGKTHTLSYSSCCIGPLPLKSRRTNVRHCSPETVHGCPVGTTIYYTYIFYTRRARGRTTTCDSNMNQTTTETRGAVGAHASRLAAAARTPRVSCGRVCSWSSKYQLKYSTKSSHRSLSIYKGI